MNFEIKEKNYNTYSQSYLPLDLQISPSALANLPKPTIQGPSQLHQSAETNETIPRSVWGLKLTAQRKFTLSHICYGSPLTTHHEESRVSRLSEPA